MIGRLRRHRSSDAKPPGPNSNTPARQPRKLAGFTLPADPAGTIGWSDGRERIAAEQLEKSKEDGSYFDERIRMWQGDCDRLGSVIAGYVL